VIVVGGGLSGLSSAHTVLERGGRVLLFDKNPFLGGNSTKATSGINGAGTRSQRVLKIADSPELFEEDTDLSATAGKSKTVYPLGHVLTFESGPAVEWLMERFGLDLSQVSRLGGHSQPRTHRGKEKFPGMTITYALLEKLEHLEKTTNDVKIMLKSTVTKLIEKNGGVIGVEYQADGQTKQAYGSVVIATGGFASDFTKGGLLEELRPELLHLPTTNGAYSTGDGIKMVRAIGGDMVDLEAVQVHPTGLVHPDDPDAKVKWLAAEALRGVGGLILDKEGNRFCNELGRRDYVTGEMWKLNKPPYRLVLNSAAGREIEWHCKHYQARGLFKHFTTGDAFAKEMGIPVSKLEDTFAKYNAAAKQKTDQYDKKFFDNAPFSVNDSFWVGVITPVLHYTMGGIKIDTEARVIRKSTGQHINGLFGAGEVNGGVHGINRLGGSSLLDCVVFGRVSGASAAKYLLNQRLTRGQSVSQNVIASNASPLVLRLDPVSQRIVMEVSYGSQGQAPAATSVSHAMPTSSSTSASSAPSSSREPETPATGSKTEAPKARDTSTQYTKEEVARHNKDNDCWVIVNGKVLDVTKFLDDHPGGRKAIMLYAGKDATEEFNMLHEENVIEKYAPQVLIGVSKNK